MIRRGQSAVEYGLLIALVVLLALLGGQAFGRAIHDWFEALMAQITRIPA